MLRAVMACVFWPIWYFYTRERQRLSIDDARLDTVLADNCLTQLNGFSDRDTGILATPGKPR